MLKNDFDFQDEVAEKGEEVPKIASHTTFEEAFLGVPFRRSRLHSNLETPFSSKHRF